MKRDSERKIDRLERGYGNDGRGITAEPGDGSCLDVIALNRLEQSFRQWVETSPRRDVGLSRRRILLIFLLIRYTGAKLNEIITLDPFADIDTERLTICIRARDGGHAHVNRECGRDINVAETLMKEIGTMLAEPAFREYLSGNLAVDPAFVRRKFYERAEACGFPRRLGGPEMIRRARAVELMQGSMPLSAVQRILGHSTPNLTAAHLSFSDDEIRRVTRLFMEREAERKTSARNAFFGKIEEVERGDIQSRVSLITLGGHRLTALITNDSLERMGLQLGRLVTAEVKAPWVLLDPGEAEPRCSAENRFRGEVERINRGKVSTEYTIRIDDGTALCAVVATAGRRRDMGLRLGDRVWAVFNCFAVILHAD